MLCFLDGGNQREERKHHEQPWLTDSQAGKSNYQQNDGEHGYPPPEKACFCLGGKKHAFVSDAAAAQAPTRTAAALMWESGELPRIKKHAFIWKEKSML